MTLKFHEAMKALDEGKEVEYFNTFDTQWTVFKRTTSLDYVCASDLKWRIKKQKKRLAKALCSDNNGIHDSHYYYESLEHIKEMSPGMTVVKWPHGEWIEV